MTADERIRCPWTGGDPLMHRYHDEEWGVPVHDDRKWFEFIVLDAFQAGLSWKTILHKRAAFGKVFCNFDPQRVAAMPDAAIAKALENPAIVRNRAKVAASIRNARAFLQVQAEFGSFADYIWQFTDGVPIRNAWRTLDEVPATTPLAETISKDLKKRGFRFVGPTIIYAHMQAVGMVNDHLTGCFRHSEV